MKFEEMGLSAPLLQALTKLKFTDATEIQTAAIPPALEGRDLLGCAQTGSGKTLAFALPLLNRVLQDEESCGLILTPTRELAMQITDVLYDMTDDLQHIRIACLIGGSPMFPQIRNLSKRPRLIVATPGRLNDHLERGTARLNSFNMLVLDEADRMLDMGFQPQIENVLNYLPEERQSFLFSATFPPSIQKLINRYLKNPVSAITHRPTDHVKTIKQTSVRVSSEEKLDRLVSEIQTREGTVLVFARTRGRTEKVGRMLRKEGISSTFIHGDRSQRERREAIEGFDSGKYRVMVATDVAARGLDISHIAHVINLDLPSVAEDYVHRIGRTGRAGASGEALSFISSDEEHLWRSIHRLMHGKSEEGAPRGGKPQGNPFRRKGGKSFRPQRWKKSEIGHSGHAKSESHADSPAKSASHSGGHKSHSSGQKKSGDEFGGQGKKRHDRGGFAHRKDKAPRAEGGKNFEGGQSRPSRGGKSSHGGGSGGKSHKGPGKGSPNARFR
jgi:ATP-dependent RNA helicase DeaD